MTPIGPCERVGRLTLRQHRFPNPEETPALYLLEGGFAKKKKFGPTMYPESNDLVLMNH